MLFCTDIIGIICKYVPKYKLLDWIEPLRDKLQIYSFSENVHPAAIEILTTQPRLINWFALSENPCSNAVHLLKANPEQIHWSSLSKNSNPLAIELLKANPKKIEWCRLSTNSHPLAIKLLKENVERIDWEGLSINSHPWAVQLLINNTEKICWKNLCLNFHPKIIALLQSNPEKIYWGVINSGSHPLILNKTSATEIDWFYFYSKNIHRGRFFDWSRLSRNSSSEAMAFLKNNLQSISWNGLSKNPSIFKATKNDELSSVLANLNFVTTVQTKESGLLPDSFITQSVSAS